MFRLDDSILHKEGVRIQILRHCYAKISMVNQEVRKSAKGVGAQNFTRPEIFDP